MQTEDLDDPREERQYVVTVLAYPDMADGDIIDELERKLDDLSIAVEVIQVTEAGD